MEADFDGAYFLVAFYDRLGTPRAGGTVATPPPAIAQKQPAVEENKALDGEPLKGPFCCNIRRL